MEEMSSNGGESEVQYAEVREQEGVRTDGVPGELIKYGGRKMVQQMVHIVGRIWSEGVMLAGMKKPK